MIVILFAHSMVWAQSIVEIPSSFNPVGSGARAMAMGGAFIALADDATAASWNPGGLVQLENPEVSIVLSGVRRTEDLRFGTSPEADGDQSISITDINYMSLAWPFHITGYRAAAISVSYQRLFDLNRDWDFRLVEEDGDFGLNQRVVNRQEGALPAIGLTYSTEITRWLSAGITLNLWDSNLYPTSWSQITEQFGFGMQGSAPFVFTATNDQRFDFKGYNFNVGFLWQVYNKPASSLTIGVVYKTSFKADLTKKNFTETSVSFPNNPDAGGINRSSSEEDQILEMPASYGLGLAWRYGNRLILTFDLYRTQWDDFILEDEDGNRYSPISGRSTDESDIDPTIQLRAGTQYIWRWLRYRTYEVIFPLRGGLFYDPAPAENAPDDYYGLSCGTGVTLKKEYKSWFSADIAYQYRMGRDVGDSILENLEFSENVDEHTIYVSLIYYF